MEMMQGLPASFHIVLITRKKGNLKDKLWNW
jgi:hypothetical protein